MRFITGISERWKRAFGASLTIALLAAVAVVGIALFSSEVLAAWRTPGNAEQALGSLDGVLSFDAPAATVARVKTEAEAQKSQPGKDALLAKNWKNTQNPIQDAILNIYQTAFQLNFFTNVFEAFFPNSPITQFLFNLTQNYVNAANNFLTSFGLPPVPPPVSPHS